MSGNRGELYRGLDDGSIRLDLVCLLLIVPKWARNLFPELPDDRQATDFDLLHAREVHHDQTRYLDKMRPSMIDGLVADDACECDTCIRAVTVLRSKDHLDISCLLRNKVTAKTTSKRIVHKIEPQSKQQVPGGYGQGGHAGDIHGALASTGWYRNRS